MQDEYYRQKYLKYKAKYVNLKNAQSGGVTLKAGRWIVIFPMSEFSSMSPPARVGSDYLSVSDINKKLNLKGYKCRTGDKELWKIKTSGQEVQDKAEKVAVKAATNVSNAAHNAAHNVATAASSAAHNVATAASSAARNVATAASNAAHNASANLAAINANIHKGAEDLGGKIRDAHAANMNALGDKIVGLGTSLKSPTSPMAAPAAGGGRLPEKIQLSEPAEEDSAALQQIIAAVAAATGTAKSNWYAADIKVNTIARNTYIGGEQGKD